MSREPRQAPPNYERIIPIVLVGLMVLLFILGLITLAVLMQVWPGS